MRVWFLLISFLWISIQGTMGQNLNGQWRGTFNTATNSIIAGEGDTEYVLELYIHGDEVTGYSYSYFNYPEKKYYVICRLAGSYDAASKSVIVNEEERIKGNTPSTWGDCLQTHILTFLKQGSTEKLIGRWRGFRPEGCGTGSTELERKALVRTVTPNQSAPVAKKSTPVTSTKTRSTPRQSLTSEPRTSNPSSGKAVTQSPKAPATKAPAQKPPVTVQKEPVKPQQPQKVSDVSRGELPDIQNSPVLPGYNKRSKNILKTIEVPTEDEFKVDFYDNGEIDGDTISVFYNDKLILSRQRLTDKPLTINIKLDTTREINELIMYADNLGSIPPNTALMIATIAGKRHEVYITSTEKSSGTIMFKRKIKQ
ncbi:MAG: hypothetical protein H3C48_11480 [Chitinophagaceae bacterium]|nr:hypothetical protein [Chitinophagaceae bacterium]